jgi:serine/threonine-protein kinase
MLRSVNRFRRAGCYNLFRGIFLMIDGKLGPWVIEKELGRGGMGRVYVAHHELDGRQAAVKILAPELAQAAGFLYRFQREIDALSQLDHPHIVHFYEAGLQEGHYYYVMEYIEGQSFEELLQERGRLPWPEVLDAALQICPALKHAHDRGIIHRDLKPPNLLRTAAGVVKLTDFGIAKVFAGQRLTHTGGIVGTAEYLSPEQAAGKPVTKRSDLYCLGVVLYTFLTGRTPFAGTSFVDLLHKHRFGQFERPAKLVPEIPYELDEVVCRLLEKDPSDRPADGLVLQRLLETIRRKQERKAQGTLAGQQQDPTHVDSDEALAARPEGPATLMSRLVRQELDRQNYGGPVRRFFNRPLVLVTLFLLSVGGIVWGFFLRGEDQEPEPKPGAATAHSVSEAERIYRLGLRHQEEGDPGAALRDWGNLIRVFDGVESEKTWVRKAREGVQQLGEKADERRWDSVRAALRRARKLRDQARELAAGKPDEAKTKRHQAETIWRGIEELYGPDPSARAVLAEMRRDRGR